MDIYLIKEVQSSADILNQVKNNIIARIQQAVNVTGQTQTLILPIVPKGIKFPVSTQVDGYKGIRQEYNVPSFRNLSTVEWSSFFPNKPYPFIHNGSSSNGYEYVEFLNERLINQLPFRLVAIEKQRVPFFKILYDRFVLVESFDYSLDDAGDLQYSIKLKEFNAGIVIALNTNDLRSALASTAVNTVTNSALRATGLI